MKLEQKIKHLEFIQSVINRMANTSFLLKGWSITVIAGLFALGIKDLNVWFFFLDLVFVALFWLLDSYFLRQERLYRRLYEVVRKKPEEEIDFSMSIKNFEEEVSFCSALFSKTLLPFYGLLLLTLLLGIIKLTMN